MSKQYLIIAQGQSETAPTFLITAGKKTVIKANQQQNFQLVDKATDKAPREIMASKKGRNLEITFEGGDRDSADVILEGYYDEPGARLVGEAENGKFYNYIPTNNESASAISNLTELAQAPQVLGGESYIVPFYTGVLAGGGAVAAGGLLYAALGGLILAAASGGSGGSSQPTIVNKTPPLAPSLAIATDSGLSTDKITNVNTVNVSGLEAGATWQYSLDGGTTWLAGTGTSFDMAADTSYVAGKIQVRQTDVAGNQSAAAQNVQQWQEDSTAPVITPITIVLDATGVTAGNDFLPRISARGTAGAYVVIWEGQDQNMQPSSTDSSIYVQNFSAAGVPIGVVTKLELADNTAGQNRHSVVTSIGADGAYVVAWRGKESVANGNDDSVFVQRFDSNSALSGTLRKLEGTNITTGTDQHIDVTEVGSVGDYVVAWRGVDPATGDTSIYLQKFAADGTTIQGQQMFQATGNNMNGWDYLPQVTALGTTGEFVLTYHGVDPSGANGGAIGGDESVYVQKFGIDGLPALGLPQVLLEATGNELGLDFNPDIAAVGTSGAFAVCWYGQDVNALGDFSIYVQNFNASGIATGAKVMLEATANTTGSDITPKIKAVGTAGAYVVAWEGIDAGQTDASIYVQNFNASGATVGNPIKLEAPGNTAGKDQLVQIAALGTGGAYVVTWQGIDANGDDSIFVQRFDTTGNPVGTPLMLEATGNTTGIDGAPQVSAVGTAGAFVVTWTGQDPTTNDFSIYVQNFAADGSPAYPVKSSEAGTGYLVHSSVTVGDLASITGAADNLWNSVAITAADTATLIATGGLLAGAYSLFTADVAGNLSLAAATTRQVTPIALDLSGDGVISYSHINLDVNGDGALDRTAWTAAQDGVLVWDKYHDQSIHGHEQYAFSQYGGNTDLQGLALAFDSNQDGTFNAVDNLFSQFAVWQDGNMNGIADQGEMQSLASLGISAINLVSDGVERRPNADVVEFGQGQANLADGRTMLLADAQFAYTEQQLLTPLGYVLGA
jgi:hypothetical protein